MRRSSRPRQDNTSIYQNVSTGNGGVLYKIRLKHASLCKDNVDKMQVVINGTTHRDDPRDRERQGRRQGG